jgi:methyl acetate hydrolase
MPISSHALSRGDQEKSQTESPVWLAPLEAGPNGRSAGSLSWAGLRNTYYWLDPAKRVTGLIMSQILPFADPQVLALYRAFERSFCSAIDPA